MRAEGAGANTHKQGKGSNNNQLAVSHGVSSVVGTKVRHKVRRQTGIRPSHNFNPSRGRRAAPAAHGAMMNRRLFRRLTAAQAAYEVHHGLDDTRSHQPGS